MVQLTEGSISSSYSVLSQACFCWGELSSKLQKVQNLSFFCFIIELEIWGRTAQRHHDQAALFSFLQSLGLTVVEVALLFFQTKELEKNMVLPLSMPYGPDPDYITGTFNKVNKI